MSGSVEQMGIEALLNKIRTMQRNGKNAASVWADVEEEYRRTGRHGLADQIAEMCTSLGR